MPERRKRPAEGRARAGQVSRAVFFSLFLFFFTAFSVAGASRTVYPEPEAKAWLANAAPDVRFAPQRFPTRQAADRFFNKLYSAGALYIGIVSCMGEATGLRIYLPLDKEKRQGLFRIVKEELEDSGYAAEDDREQETLDIWFK